MAPGAQSSFLDKADVELTLDRWAPVVDSVGGMMSDV